MRFVRFFLYSAAIILMITAAAKFAASFGSVKILDYYEPVTGFQYRFLFRVVGGIEAVIGLSCFLLRSTWHKVFLVTWLSACFLVYRLCLLGINYRKPCNCLGILTDVLHIRPEKADLGMKFILAYLLIGGCAALLCLFLQKGNSSSRDPLLTSRISC